MDFPTRLHGNLTLATLPRQLVMANADETKAALTNLCSVTRHLALDMGETQFLDSSGLAVLISLHKRLAAGEGRLLLIRPHANVRALIALTQLHQLFPIYEDDLAAIQQFEAA
ncbi:STAS domain-containing protein [Onishia taeanensis]